MKFFMKLFDDFEYNDSVFKIEFSKNFRLHLIKKFSYVEIVIQGLPCKFERDKLIELIKLKSNEYKNIVNLI